MVGVIRKRDVLSHPMVTIRCFGWRVFVRTVLAGRDRTFLSVLTEADILEAQRVLAPEVIERCVNLELRAMRLYGRLADRFPESPAARDFFTNLSIQEEEHAQLLQLCQEATKRGRWEARAFERHAEALPRLENAMRDAVAGVDRIETVSAALRLAVSIESSEVNRVFDGVVAATDSEFVKAIGTFHAATQGHLGYISRRAAEIDPGLEVECKALRASLPARADS
jgi:rubrerythrin